MNFKQTYKKISPEQFIIIIILFVNTGFYFDKVLLGRILGPAQSVDTTILITLLLVMPFVATTFQMIMAKYTLLFENGILNQFLKFIFKNTLAFGLLLGFLITIYNQQLKQIFNTKTAIMSVIFGLGLLLYFVAWMFTTLLLPKLIQLKKDGTDTLPIFLKYVFYIVLLSTAIILGAFLFPELLVNVMFGKKYILTAFLLWENAFTTSIFAEANIFAYNFLSINKYITVIISDISGLIQIILIVLFHNSFIQFVIMQVITMITLLAFKSSYFLSNKNIKVKSSLN